MGYRLALAEKPSVAQAIAKVLGATKRCDGYLEGNGWLEHCIRLEFRSIYCHCLLEILGSRWILCV